ncbi:ribosomal large subunit pseudouridine synthase B [Echinicola strongylocentroti]|uniref:Pseudouridine synthase n=1 Tax=Echinicola strongylocentroti TaxID=1795355 RepID=A0A2Z4IIN6_9BACT|nr:pseudouridine synthase [Echinicola strongylocentroti]AWW30416.1 ribosomal large subunit pseudouridine synthase B [Echinicola strongylocentroti]
MKKHNRNNRDDKKKTGDRPHKSERSSSPRSQGKPRGSENRFRNTEKGKKFDPDFSPLQKYRQDKPSAHQDNDESTPQYKTVYKGRGRDQKPVFGSEKVHDQGHRSKTNKFKQNRFIKGNRFEKEEKPEYNLKKVKPQLTKSGSSEIRLNKFIANAGICSRRDADKLIEKGEIKVNGEVVTELGYRVLLSDKVVYKGKNISPEKPVYVLLNKPKDFITTTDDPMNRKTVMHLVASACEERIFPVGRLDRNTTGLLLFTNDGELAAKLSHPSEKIKKIYQVTLDSPITKAHFEEIIEGLTLEDGPVHVDDIQILSKDQTILGLEIHLGKNRIVRRIFAHLGYDVVALDRVTYAGLTKKDLSRGKWRFLTEKEVINLKFLKK